MDETINTPKEIVQWVCPTCGYVFYKAPRCPECGQLIKKGENNE